MSKKTLVTADKFCLATFHTTHHALHAEKVLDRRDIPFLIVPTPREISAGCGLSMRFFYTDLNAIIGKIKEEGIAVNNFYMVEKADGRSVIAPMADLCESN